MICIMMTRITETGAYVRETKLKSNCEREMNRAFAHLVGVTDLR